MEPTAVVQSVGRAFPRHYYDQDTLIAALKARWGKRHFNLDRLEQLHRHVLVGGRHLALPIEAYAALDSFTASNNAYLEVGLELAEASLKNALAEAELEASAIDQLFFVSVTGIGTPSLDARLMNRLPLRKDLKRSPMFGLGCVAGAAGIARAADYLKGHPNQIVALVSVELCSLTLQQEDLSIQNIISSGLFGDGAAAVILAGAERASSLASRGPKVLASRSVFYPDTERAMGWDIGAEGFKVVLSAEVPRIVERHLRADATSFLADHGLSLGELKSVVCHPGGPKILEAIQRELGLTPEALELTWDSLRRIGNLSSASVLSVLKDTLELRRPAAGTPGLLMAMGPGFCSELVLLKW